MKTPNVASFSAIAANGRPVQFTIGTDVIDHYESSQTFGRQDLADPDAHGRFQRRMIAIPDRKQNVVTPMVLTISSNNELYLVRQDETVSSGWRRIDLSSAFSQYVGNDPQVQAIGAGWTDDDRITLAVAVEDRSGQSRSRLLVAYNLSSRETNWEQIAWVDYGIREDIRIEGIRVLDENASAGAWTIVIAGDRGPSDMLYLLRNTNKQTFATAFVFNPAVTMQTIFDFEVGVHPIYGGGVHLLGLSGGARVLAFRPFPEYSSQGRPRTSPPVVVLPCPPGATVLESGVTYEDGADLYIAGQGVQLITAAELDNAESAKVVQVVSVEVAPNVEDIVVGDRPNGSAVVWTLLQNGDLNVVQRNADQVWQTPLTLRRGVQAIAPIEGDDHTHTSVLVVYSDFRASFVLKDATSGVWQETPLLVDNPSELTRVTCYGTKLRVLDEYGVARANVSVTVSASVLSSVRLNRAAVFIGPSVSVTTQTDEDGSVTLLDRVDSLTPAIYRCSVEGVKEALDINPAAQLHQQFASLTVNELLNASIQTPDGKQSLLPPEMQDPANHPQIQAVVDVLRETASLARSTTGVLQGVQQVNENDPFSSALRSDSLPDNYRWGIQTDASGVRLADRRVIDRLSNAPDTSGTSNTSNISNNISTFSTVKTAKTPSRSSQFFSNLGDSIVDFFEGVGDRIRDEFAVVVQKTKYAFDVVCEWGGKVKRFVLKTLDQVGSFFKWVWAQIKIGINKVREFFKLLLNWDDILVVRDGMVDLTDDLLNHVMDSVDDLKQPVKDGFDQLLKQIRAWRGTTPKPTNHQKPSNVGKKLISVLNDIPTPHQKIIEQVTGSAVFTWVNDKIKDGIDELIQFEGSNPLATAENAATTFAENLLSDQVSSLVNCWQEIQTNLVEIFGHQMPSFSDFTTDTLKELVVMVGATALEGMLTGLRDLILRTIDLLGDFVRVARDAMFLKVRFPLLEKLIKLIVPGANVDTSFRLIDGLMLLAAIPATFTYKTMILMLGDKIPPLPKRGEALILPMQGLVVQSTSERLQQSSLIAGLVFTNLSIGSTFSKTVFKLLGKEDANKKVMQTISAVLAGFSFVQECYSWAGTKSSIPGIDDLKQTGTFVSGLNLINQTARLFPVFAQSSDLKMIEKISASVEICCHTAQLLLKTAIFSLATNETRKNGEQQKQISDSLTWTKHVFDRTGGALISSSTLVEDKKIKLILITSGLTGRRCASILDLARVFIAGEHQKILQG